MNKAEEHYEANYFEQYQKGIGQFGGKAGLFMFEKFISKNDRVMDFGCGGGFLLKEIDCKEKVGVEINDVARQYCNQSGIKCVKDIDEFKDGTFDVIISSHCLEHTTTPFDIVGKMYKKLKAGGKVVIVVPLDSYETNWHKGNVDYHLYSFSPMNLGNLLDANGFKEIKTETILHK